MPTRYTVRFARIYHDGDWADERFFGKWVCYAYAQIVLEEYDTEFRRWETAFGEEVYLTSATSYKSSPRNVAKGYDTENDKRKSWQKAMEEAFATMIEEAKEEGHEDKLTADTLARAKSELASGKFSAEYP